MFGGGGRWRRSDDLLGLLVEVEGEGVAEGPAAGEVGEAIDTLRTELEALKDISGPMAAAAAAKQAELANLVAQR